MKIKVHTLVHGEVGSCGQIIERADEYLSLSQIMEKFIVSIGCNPIETCFNPLGMVRVIVSCRKILKKLIIRLKLKSMKSLYK